MTASYAETLAYISQMGRFGMKLGTERTRALLDELGADHGLRGALIAGTNGKGSTGACLSSILRAAGHHVGFMPKPHLVSYTERIELDGVPISEGDFVREFETLKPTLDAVGERLGNATEFEMLTVLAVAYLAPRADLLVCEVGLGGRLDATNALDLGVAVITNVDYDHQKYLGDTIEQIAREKAAIIKPGNQVVTGCEGVALAIVEERATRAGANLWRLGREIQVAAEPRGWDGHIVTVTGPGFEHADLGLPLVGDYQPANAALAVAAAHALASVSDDAVRAGLASARWPGRLHVISAGPRVVVDGGHNQAALRQAGESLRRLIRDERLVIVFGMLSERDPNQLLPQLRAMKPAAVVFTEPASAAGHVIAASTLSEMYGRSAESIPRAAEALARARELAGADGTVLVCGSLYLAGEVLALTGAAADPRPG
jgi:dihydrofolate synthase/folylpolyglutamate synthase